LSHRSVCARWSGYTTTTFRQRRQTVSGVRSCRRRRLPRVARVRRCGPSSPSTTCAALEAADRDDDGRSVDCGWRTDCAGRLHHHRRPAACPRAASEADAGAEAVDKQTSSPAVGGPSTTAVGFAARRHAGSTPVAAAAAAAEFDGRRRLIAACVNVELDRSSRIVIKIKLMTACLFGIANLQSLKTFLFGQFGHTLVYVNCAVLK